MSARFFIKGRSVTEDEYTEAWANAAVQAGSPLEVFTRHWEKKMDARCYLCLATGGNHMPECRATPEGTVDLGQGHAWRAGVKAAQDVMKGSRGYMTHELDEARRQILETIDRVAQEFLKQHRHTLCVKVETIDVRTHYDPTQTLYSVTTELMGEAPHD